jgi:serine/threonine-protein kinase
MSPEHLIRVSALFEDAIALDPRTRDAYLDRACANRPDLRRHVQALLDADQRSTRFIEPPTIESISKLWRSPPIEPDIQLPAGTRLGAYRVLRPIASGGMGTVYLAERSDKHFEQRVAIKVLKRGVDTDAVLWRFRVERQTLANLNHPNIARLLDGGVTGDDLPYIVMEYIEGEPIDDYCRKRKLSIDERLRIFRAVCSAVQHAHQKLVIHRDIKPANILITPDGVPKLLDFGIAKVLDPTDSDGATTLPDARPMTPAFASPEQVRGETVTTATDVYSLGVVLYLLLTGHSPYQLAERSASEIQRAVCEQTPKPPSTRACRTEKLRRALSGDLDAIVLTAMHKDAARRYPSVERFAEDIDRYFAKRPIHARLDSWAYRAGKLIKRRPALSVVSAALAVAMVVGAAGITWQARIAIHERDVAKTAIVRADEQARRSRIEAEKARQISTFVRNMFASAHPEHEGMDVTVREVLDEAAARIESDLRGQPEIEAEVRTTIGQTYQGLGLYEAAETHLRAALDMREGTSGGEQTPLAYSMVNLGALLSDRGSYDEAMALLESAGGLVRETGERHEQLRAAIEENVANILRKKGAFDDAIGKLRSALSLRAGAEHADELAVASTLTLLAGALQEKGEFAEAESAYREALRIKRERLGEGHPRVADDLNALGVLLRRMAKFDEAEVCLREAVEIRRTKLGNKHPALATSLHNLGLVLKDGRKIDEAEGFYRAALAINRDALGPDHPDLGGTLNDLAGILREKRDFEGAEACLREALDIVRRKFGPSHRHVGTALHNLGRLFHYQNRFEEAETHYRQALEVKRTALGDAHPDLATTLNNLGALYINREDYAAAKPILTEALDLRRSTLPAGHPRIGRSLYELGMVLLKTGDAAAAEPLIRESLEICEATAPDDEFAIAMTKGLLGECLMTLGHYDEAEPLLVTSYDALLSKSGKESVYTQRAHNRLVTLRDTAAKAQSHDGM